MAEQLSEAWRRALLAETRSGAHGAGAAAPRVPCLTVLWHPDVRRVGQRATAPGLEGGRRLELSRTTPIFGGAGGAAGPLADPFLSRRPLELRRKGERLRLSRGDHPGSVAADGAPLGPALERPWDELEGGVVLELAERIVLLVHRGPPVAPAAGRHPEIVGASEAVEALRSEIDAVADHAGPVLIRGETGSGKELVARAIHAQGSRADAPFVAINLAAVPEALAAAELFGAEKGAFTGAACRRSGAFRRAHRGTLFLDEVGDTPASVQPLLLRALDLGEIQPVGADRTVRVDVRLLAATDLDLEAALEDQRFRGPLFHRLGGYELTVPPLRARRDDLGRLLLHFLRRELSAAGRGERLSLDAPDARPWLPAPVVGRLARHRWPGNVRELRNVARALATSGRDGAEASLPASHARRLSDAAKADPGSADAAPRWRGRPAEIPEAVLVETLERHRWSLAAAAAELGISRTSLYRRVDDSPSLRRIGDLDDEDLRGAYQDLGGDLERLVERLRVSKDALRRRLGALGLR